MIKPSVREKALHHGSVALSDSELLQVILGHGQQHLNVATVAEQLLAKSGGLQELMYLTEKELLAYPGIGPAKSAAIMASLELGRRALKASTLRHGSLCSPEQVAVRMITRCHGLLQEQLVAFFLDIKNQVIREQVMFICNLSSSPAYPREIFQQAFRCNAAHLILVHNHPSGDVTPSSADRQFTEKMEHLGRQLGVLLLGHLIVGAGKYYSFAQASEKVSQNL